MANWQERTLRGLCFEFPRVSSSYGEDRNPARLVGSLAGLDLASQSLQTFGQELHVIPLIFLEVKAHAHK